MKPDRVPGRKRAETDNEKLVISHEKELYNKEEDGNDHHDFNCEPMAEAQAPTGGVEEALAKHDGEEPSCDRGLAAAALSTATTTTTTTHAAGIHNLKSTDVPDFVNWLDEKLAEYQAMLNDLESPSAEEKMQRAIAHASTLQIGAHAYDSVRGFL